MSPSSKKKKPTSQPASEPVDQYQGSLRRTLADLDLAFYQDVLHNLVSDSVDSSLLERHIINRQTTRPQLSAFEDEIDRLRAEIERTAKALFEQTVDAEQKGTRIEELRNNLQTLTQKQNLSHLISRVRVSAQEKLLESEEFRNLFSQDSPCPAYVLSIDIRRSTELMLKARDPKLYASFIISLAKQLREVILENYGVFDKFTGDGILAFFPDFYSGEDAGLFALRAATKCHQIFSELYENSRHCFVSILKEIGLGVGIDFGQVQIVQIGGDFTVVGTPVVYACRMGGAEAGRTVVNQPAYEVLFEKYSAICDFKPCEISIKHEGKTLAYEAEFNGKAHQFVSPTWTSKEEEMNRDPTSIPEDVQTSFAS